MATQRLAPASILAQDNYFGTLAAIDEDPDSPDAQWLSAVDTAANTSVRVSFATPLPDLDTGLVQEIRARVRKVGGSSNPTCTLEVWESGSLLTTLVAETTISSTSGVVVSGLWDASLLQDSTGAGVEVRVAGTAPGGSPSKRSTVEVGAVEWNAPYTVSVPAKSGSVSISGGGAIAASGSVARFGQVALAGGGSVQSTGTIGRFGSAAITGGGTIVATGSGSTLIEKSGSVVLSGGGSIAASGLRAVRGLASISAGGSVVASGIKGSRGSAVVTGGGSVMSAGKAARRGIAVLAGGGRIIASGFATGASAIVRCRNSMAMMGVGT